MGEGPIGPKQKLSCNYVAFQLSALELTLLTTMMIMMKMLNQILAAMNITGPRMEKEQIKGFDKRVLDLYGTKLFHHSKKVLKVLSPTKV